MLVTSCWAMTFCACNPVPFIWRNCCCWRNPGSICTGEIKQIFSESTRAITDYNEYPFITGNKDIIEFRIRDITLKNHLAEPGTNYVMHIYSHYGLCTASFIALSWKLWWEFETQYFTISASWLQHTPLRISLVGGMNNVVCFCYCYLRFCLL